MADVWFISKRKLENYAMDVPGGKLNLEQIHNFPAVSLNNYVPVVRCRYCEFSREINENLYKCILTTYAHSGEHFCSDGKQWESNAP